MEVLTGFVSALNRGDVEEAVAFLADDLPEVVGLGTVSYPYSPTDPGLWDAGTLQPENVAGFVSFVSALNGTVAVSDCSGFADGPSVVIASCLYQAPEGLLRSLGMEDQAGRLFGFVVDGEVAGVAASGTYDFGAWERIELWAAGSGSDVVLTRQGNGFSTGAAQAVLAALAKMAEQPTPR